LSWKRSKEKENQIAGDIHDSATLGTGNNISDAATLSKHAEEGTIHIVR